VSNNNSLSSAAMELEEMEQREAVEAVSVQELDSRLLALKELKDNYDSAKDVSDALYKEFEGKKMELFNILQSINRDRYQLDGVGTLYPVERGGYKMPSELEKKLQLFNFIQGKYGQDTLRAMLVIKDADLSKFVKAEIESGTQVPGVGDYVSSTQVSFRKGK